MIRLQRWSSEAALPLAGVVLLIGAGLPSFFIASPVAPIGLALLATSLCLARRLPMTSLALGLVLLIAQLALPALRFGAFLGPWQVWLYGALLVVIAVTTVTLPHSRVRCAFGFAVIAALCVAALNSLPLGGSTTVTYSWDSPDLAGQIASWALGSLLVFIGVWAIAFAYRRSLAALDAQRAARESALSALSAAEGELLLAGERDRIAQEVHDVLAHSLAVIVAQAEGARVAAKTEQTSVPLRTIADTARQTLGDVRWLIDALGAPGDDAPAPGVADLDALFERMQQAGLPVRVQQLGSPGALSPVSELSAHRIVQEALTNALVHGAVERGADVSLDWQDAGLAVTVVSRATGEAPVAGSGRGVTGMQERARLAGGWLSAARDEQENSWIVTAYLPARTRGGEDE
ncbi:MAG: sensor histidine kinase [Microbacterium sp.]